MSMERLAACEHELRACLGDSALGRCCREGAAPRWAIWWREVPRLCPALSAGGRGSNPNGSPAEGRPMPPIELDPSRSELGWSLRRNRLSR